MTTLPTIDERGFTDLFLNGTPLIDVRAPVEFLDGAFPTSHNLPLMNNEERHAVGKRYKDNGQDAAIALGHKLVSGELKQARIDAWREFATTHPNGALYCFRGGLRSRTSQQWLSDAGVNYPLIEGGYKALRRFLIETLDHWVSRLPAVVVGGRTGTGKTRVLNACDRAIDLEGLANHRGSSFGAMLSGQPSNIDFENALAVEYLKLATDSSERSVVLEDEARMIGRVSLPQVLRNRLGSSPIALLDVPFEERVQNVLEDYVIDLSADYQQRDGQDEGLKSFYAHHENAVQRVQKRLGGDNTKQALRLLENAHLKMNDSGDDTGFRHYIAFLLQRYYDPMYDYQISHKQSRIQFQGNADDIVDWIAHQDLSNV